MSDVARATRATLAALAGGASPAQALAAAGTTCERPALGAAYARAADDLGNDTFRPDVFGRLEWSPPVVGLLLSRAPRAALPRVADAALRALHGAPFRPARVVVRWVTGQLAVAVMILAILLRWTLGGVQGRAGFDRLELGVALGLGALLTMVLAEVVAAVGKRRLSDAQTLRWLIAGELAQVPPGAVLGPLVEHAHPLGRRVLERMRQGVRGTATMRDAIVLWAEDGGLAGPAARLVGLVPDGEDPVTATERMARVAALDRPARVDRVLLTLSSALTVAAVLVLAQVVLVSTPGLWGFEG